MLNLSDDEAAFLRFNAYVIAGLLVAFVIIHGGIWLLL